MIRADFPNLSSTEVNTLFTKARSSERLRYPKILHKKGDYFNHVYNFLIKGSYMQPHLHPGEEKSENIYLISGEIVVLYFDDVGEVVEYHHLDEPLNSQIEVPPFKWHTYVSLTDSSITYETMNGVYEPSTWKHYAKWAPKEVDNNARYYLSELEMMAGKLRLNN